MQVQHHNQWKQIATPLPSPWVFSGPIVQIVGIHLRWVSSMYMNWQNIVSCVYHKHHVLQKIFCSSWWSAWFAIGLKFVCKEMVLLSPTHSELCYFFRFLFPFLCFYLFKVDGSVLLCFLLQYREDFTSSIYIAHVYMGAPMLRHQRWYIASAFGVLCLILWLKNFNKIDFWQECYFWYCYWT